MPIRQLLDMNNNRRVCLVNNRIYSRADFFSKTIMSNGKYWIPKYVSVAWWYDWNKNYRNIHVTQEKLDHLLLLYYDCALLPNIVVSNLVSSNWWSWQLTTSFISYVRFVGIFLNQEKLYTATSYLTKDKTHFEFSQNFNWQQDFWL